MNNKPNILKLEKNIEKLEFYLKMIDTKLELEKTKKLKKTKK